MSEFSALALLHRNDLVQLAELLEARLLTPPFPYARPSGAPPHRAMLAGVGLEPGAVDAHQAYAQQLQLPGKQQNLQEALRHRSEVLPPEAHDRVVVGVKIRRDEANPDIAMRRPLDPTAGENPIGVAVDHKRQHHPRVILRRARAAMVHLEDAQIDALDRLDHEMRQIIRRDPVPQIGRKQKRLVPITVNEVAHPVILRQIQPKVRQTASTKTSSATQYRNVRFPTHLTSHVDRERASCQGTPGESPWHYSLQSNNSPILSLSCSRRAS